MGISGVIGRIDIGVWMRRGGNGNAAATGDQRRRIAKFDERSRGKFTDFHGDSDGDDEHNGDVASEQHHRRKFHDRND